MNMLDRLRKKHVELNVGCMMECGEWKNRELSSIG